ncbi:MAG TPA: segregation/condensation protein A [Thermoanaerobaculia bacterium]|nr:segregation/condensation protein A [Thermoanaerobaculia bacterium]
MSDEEIKDRDETTPHPPAAPSPLTRGEGEEDDESAYKVTLPTFHGPLDLLLHLIRKHEVDIHDIPILLITEQYNAYLDTMAELDLDIAADYIYMAALLINIKSRMLLPRDESEGEQGDDPRRELVDKLLEYQRFRAVAESFAELDVLRMGMWSRPRVPLPGDEPAEVDMSDVGLFDLIDAFRTALVRYRQNHPQAIELQRTVHKVSDKMRELYAKVREKSPIRLQWFLEGRDRNELIAVFLGMLELVRLGSISLQQGGIFGEILINVHEKEIGEETFALFDNT